MKENKRYYWLKLKDDFFDDDTISYIEEQENGVYYVNFYLKLCLKSLKTEGRLVRFVGEILIPYDINSLSNLTRTPVDTVRVAMTFFEKISLIKIMETGEIYLSQIQEMIGTETDKAAIMRRKRAREKLSGNNVTELLPDCYTEIEKEKELDIREREESRINYQEIIDLYHETCVSFPRVRTISESRKKAIRARIKSGYTIEDFKRLFQMAEQSDFLKGKNGRDWNADFDWMIKDSNMPKILEGKYLDRKKEGVADEPPEDHYSARLW